MSVSVLFSVILLEEKLREREREREAIGKELERERESEKFSERRKMTRRERERNKNRLLRRQFVEVALSVVGPDDDLVHRNERTAQPSLAFFVFHIAQKRIVV